MRLKLIACEVMFRDLCRFAATSPNQVDLEFLPKGLHDRGDKRMRERLQSAIDAVDPKQADAIGLAYGLCGNGVIGLRAGQIRLVIPKAHDCITLFLGSKERYSDYFHSHPGTYFLTSGWIERGQEEGICQPSADAFGQGFSWEELVEKYGEDNARYVLDQMLKHYRQVTYIRTGIEPDDRFERFAQEQANQRDWEFELVLGDTALLQNLVDGLWNEREFLTVLPGQQVGASFDDEILVAQQTGEKR